MVKDVQNFCTSCGVCQTTKTDNRRPQGLLHPLSVPHRPWGSIGMDFVGPFLEANGYDYCLVVICRLTSMVHLLPITKTIKASEVTFLYLSQIVRLHGMPDSIVSDRDPKFTSAFWQELQRLLGAKLRMSTAFHPQTDGATERAIRIVSQILRAEVSPDQKNWYEKLPMVEFAINSSISASTGFAPFELNYGYLPRMMAKLGANPEVPKGVRQFAETAALNLVAAHDAIIASRVEQTFQANKKRRKEPEYKMNDLAYLSTENLNLPKKRARKLLPRFIGPYRVIEVNPDLSTYTLELPEELARRRIHPVFHASRLRRHEPNDDAVFPHREVKVFYDFRIHEKDEWLVEAIIGHRWSNGKVEFQVRWNLGDTTWEPYTNVNQLEALDNYLDLRGVNSWRALPKRAS
jgi:hypothetical protein